MSKGMITLAIVGVIVFALCGFGCSALSFRSDAIAQEAGIKAQYDADKNGYDNMWKSVREMSQVAEAYAGDLKKLFDGAMQGRYGADGSRAVIQFIHEHNPTLPPEMYTKLQARIEAGRNEFTSRQDALIDRKRQYEQFLGTSRALFFNPIFNFPRIDLDKFKIITSEKTETEFNAGKADEVKLR